jgi:hypothetical protein
MCGTLVNAKFLQERSQLVRFEFTPSVNHKFMNDFVKLVFDHSNKFPDHWVSLGLASQKYNPTKKCTVVKEQDKELVLTITLYRELLKIHMYFVKGCHGTLGDRGNDDLVIFPSAQP